MLTIEGRWNVDRGGDSAATKSENQRKQKQINWTLNLDVS